MKVSSLSKLPLTADEGWPELVRSRLELWKLFAFIVMPLSLLPPVMLYFAGTRHPEMFHQWAGGKVWSQVAVVFFLAEILTVLFMGWFIKQVAETSGLRIDYRDSYLLAAIAPLPLWLSSLGLLVPDLRVSAVLSLAAIGLTCGLVYHGIKALCDMRENVTAASIVQTVIGVGLIAWALLLALALG